MGTPPPEYDTQAEEKSSRESNALMRIARFSAARSRCRLLIQSFQMSKSAGGREHRCGDGSVVGHVHQETCTD